MLQNSAQSQLYVLETFIEAEIKLWRFERRNNKAKRNEREERTMV